LILLQECAVTADVSQKMTLNSAQTNAAENIRKAMGSTCVKVQYEKEGLKNHAMAP
jgi:hypothetical protein